MKPTQLETPVKYGVSPAKAAQAERECSSESEESSYSSEEDQPVAERGRKPVRCASPRRSASPMRRIQIGMTGSRRSTPLTIKSLPYIPARERTNSSDDEQPRKPERNITRLSVQDAVKLFENKQKEQTVEGQKDRPLSKSVLRRWSAGTSENSKFPSDIASEPFRTGPITSETNSSKVNVDIDDIEEASQQMSTSAISEKWSRQKEAEVNQMVETRPTEYQSIPDIDKKIKIPSNTSKEKKDLKVRGATAGKQAEKEKQSGGMQQVSGKTRSAMASKISENANKPHKAIKSMAQPAKPTEVAPKPAVIRSTKKSSPLPTTRKSGPSTPSPRGTVAKSATTTSSVPLAGATTARFKPQPTLSVPQLRQKPMKVSQEDLKKNTKAVGEKNLQKKVKSGKTTKPVKSQPAAVNPYNKVTKKSSVVPLESKPFLKKGSRIGSGVGPPVKTKSSPNPEISVRKSGDLLLAKENDVEGVQVRGDTDSEVATERFQTCEEQEVTNEITEKNNDTSKKIMESSSLAETEEETVISPAAWVEIEEEEHQPCQIESSSNSEQVKMPSPRVRHSLSQMLLEETNESHVIGWGNAENPPSMMSQKDAPKGLKRLLKFARKSKTDASSSGLSCPEGEDDTDDSKAVNKKNAENLLKKATLRSLESYEDNAAIRELSGQANTSNIFSQTLIQKLQEGHGHGSAPVTSTKASRSFFSLSAFKGGN